MPFPESETQRLFFAFWPPAELSRELHRFADIALRGGAGRRVVPENIHLTLAFLGPVDASIRQCAEQAVAAVRGEPFTLVLDQSGCWPKPGVLWVGPARAPAPLLNFVRSLNSALTGCGFEAEQRPYAAHLTLARKVRCQSLHPAQGYSWEIDRFHLVLSRTHKDGAQYEILRSWTLDPSAERY